MADKTMPTPGPWTYEPSATDWPAVVSEEADWDIGAVCLIPPFEGYERTQIDANARLIAAAGAAAHECAEMGYDPIEAVRALPQVLRALASMHDDPNTYADDAAAEALARAAGKEGA